METGPFGGGGHFRIVWGDLCIDVTNKSDQPYLLPALAQVPEARFMTLPVEYCFVADPHRRLWPYVAPVIEHHVAHSGPLNAIVSRRVFGDDENAS